MLAPARPPGWPAGPHASAAWCNEGCSAARWRQAPGPVSLRHPHPPLAPLPAPSSLTRPSLPPPIGIAKVVDVHKARGDYDQGEPLLAGRPGEWIVQDSRLARLRSRAGGAPAQPARQAAARGTREAAAGACRHTCALPLGVGVTHPCPTHATAGIAQLRGSSCVVRTFEVAGIDGPAGAIRHGGYLASGLFVSALLPQAGNVPFRAPPLTGRRRQRPCQPAARPGLARLRRHALLWPRPSPTLPHPPPFSHPPLASRQGAGGGGAAGPRRQLAGGAGGAARGQGAHGGGQRGGARPPEWLLRG